MILSLATVLFMTVNGQWDYLDADGNLDGDFNSVWIEGTPECGFDRQSPINLPEIKTCDADDNVFAVDVEAMSGKWRISNTRFSLTAVPFIYDDSNPAAPTINWHDNTTTSRLKNSFFDTFESNVNKEYCLDSFHFHWARTSDEGSEHFIDNEQYPLCLHFVHYSCDYANLGAAAGAYVSGEADTLYDDENVLAVVGVLFEIGDANPAIDAFLNDNILPNVEAFDPDSGNDNLFSMLHAEFSMNDMLPASREAFAYLGSLTTPPCWEAVRWHVLKNTMTVSEEQMEKLRQLSYTTATDGSTPQAPNWRPPQPLNDRTVYQCESDIAADMVDKEPIPSETDGEVERWRDIAMVFISAFSVSIIGCLICVFYCYKQKNAKIQNEVIHSQDDRIKNKKSGKTGNYDAI